MEQSLKLTRGTGNLAVQALALNVYCRIVCQFAENEQNKWSFLYILQQEALTLTRCVVDIEKKLSKKKYAREKIKLAIRNGIHPYTCYFNALSQICTYHIHENM